jgi:hypothetical protein
MYLFNPNKFTVDFSEGKVTEKSKRNLTVLWLCFAIFGWAAGSSGFSNFYSDLPSIIIMALYIFILIIPVFSVYSAFKSNGGENGKGFVEKFICLSALIITKLSISYAIIVFIYAVIFTLFREYDEGFKLSVDYYLFTGLTIIYELIFIGQLNKYMKKIAEY